LPKCAGWGILAPLGGPRWRRGGTLNAERLARLVFYAVLGGAALAVVLAGALALAQESQLQVLLLRRAP
jgi:hypothetical protein